MGWFSKSAWPTWTEDLGRLVLRLTVGGLMLPHGIAKATGGLGGISSMLAAKGLPEALAYGVYVGELVAPVLIIAGWYTRPAAVVLAFNMVVAVLLAHQGDLMQLNEHGGWALELQAFYLFGALAVALLGAGKYAVSGGNGKWD